MTLEVVDELQLRRALIRASAAAGGDAAFAVLHGLAPSYVTAAVHGQVHFNAALLDALGFDRVTRYVPKLSS